MLYRDALLDRIWEDDRLDRRALAEQVEHYIRSRFEQPAPGGGSFTIAVDGEYGLGKSFFLKRLAKQMAYSHPVAFVDAWADDTADDPLTSIFLAIEEALAERVKGQNSEGKARTVQKLKDVGRITAKAVIRAAGARFLTKEGVDELAGAFESGVDDIFDLKPEKSKVQPLVSRRSIISEFKKRLAELLDSLEADDLFKRPLVVIIDELDRCRPTYAIRILEEAKHFFDDTGTVFVYGMNRSALLSTVKSIYGSDFNAANYLSRFVRRHVLFPANSLVELVREQFDGNGHLADRFWFPDAVGSNVPAEAAAWIASLFQMNAINARDAEYVLEHMFSFAAMWEHEAPIHLPYLACLAGGAYRSRRGDGDGSVLRNTPQLGGSASDLVYTHYNQYGQMPLSRLIRERSNSNRYGPALEAIIHEIALQFGGVQNYDPHHDSERVSQISEYLTRLNAVGKFLTLPPERDKQDGESKNG